MPASQPASSSSPEPRSRSAGEQSVSLPIPPDSSSGNSEDTVEYHDDIFVLEDEHYWKNTPPSHIVCDQTASLAIPTDGDQTIDIALQVTTDDVAAALGVTHAKSSPERVGGARVVNRARNEATMSDRKSI